MDYTQRWWTLHNADGCCEVLTLNLCILINKTSFKYPVVFDCVTQRGSTRAENSEAEKSESVAMFNGILQLLKWKDKRDVHMCTSIHNVCVPQYTMLILLTCMAGLITTLKKQSTGPAVSLTMTNIWAPLTAVTKWSHTLHSSAAL